MKEPRIEKLARTQLIGLGTETSLAENKTFELWRTFKQNLKTIKDKEPTFYYSVQKYNNDFPKTFSPTSRFNKWAAVEKNTFTPTSKLPSEFQSLELSGLYAVFIHKGTSATFPKTAQYIYGVWLPNSKYEIDDNFHFELMSNDYLANDPESEEEVWIPIKEK